MAKLYNNSTKHLATKMSSFELALGVEPKQPTNLAIPKTEGSRCKGDKDAEEMAKEHEERKAWAIKVLEKLHAHYNKQANKS